MKQQKLGKHWTWEEPLLFEKTKKGRVGYNLPPVEVDWVEPHCEAGLLREEVSGFPELSENDVVRHFTRLSQKNYAIDLGFYPLGSCTMKYNPKINEEVAQRARLASMHPFWPEKFLKPALEIQGRIQELLSSLTGFECFSLQPTAGAHGEYVGMKMIEAYHRKKGNQKTKVLIPDSAHGTNPATCKMLGYEMISIPTSDDGVVEAEEVKKHLSSDLAGMMMTNPNTLGLFEEHAHEIAELLHSVDALFYMDGANLNALLGIARPADLGVDVMHINLHKTFSTPHGGGGPGAGVVSAHKKLMDFLPLPIVSKQQDSYQFEFNRPNSIGRVGGYFGNFSIHIRALAYLLSIGKEETRKISYFRKISEAAVLNANYLQNRLKEYYHLPFNRSCMHEFIITDQWQQEYGVKTINIAKRLLDYGFHPMTVYFPLVVHGAMLIEPTESETKESLDEFCDAMIAIARECKENPELVKTAPHENFRRRLDELRAQKQPKLRW